jgi:hypothetical protein
MKTQSTPTFSELQAQATKGPFLAGEPYTTEADINSVGIFALSDSEVRPADAAGDTLKQAQANAELITRLLNWAHAGGPAAMGTLYVWAKNLADNMPPSWKGQDLSIFTEQRDKARQCIAILNGEKQP